MILGIIPPLVARIIATGIRNQFTTSKKGTANI
jgi:hypothetical protein